MHKIVSNILSRPAQQYVSGRDYLVICLVEQNGETSAFDVSQRTRCSAYACVCRDAARASEEGASTTGGSLLRPQHHGGGQTTPNQGRKHGTRAHMRCFSLRLDMFAAVRISDTHTEKKISRVPFSIPGDTHFTVTHQHCKKKKLICCPGILY